MRYSTRMNLPFKRQKVDLRKECSCKITQCKGSCVDQPDSLLDLLVVHVVPDPLVWVPGDGFPPTTLPFGLELVFHVHHHHHERGRAKNLQYSALTSVLYTPSIHQLKIPQVIRAIQNLSIRVDCSFRSSLEDDLPTLSKCPSHMISELPKDPTQTWHLQHPRHL